MSATEMHAKEAIARTILEHGPLLLALDARCQGVVVPEGTQWVALAAGRCASDLEVDGEGVRGTLLFNEAPFHVTVPWEAVEQMVAPFDFPESPPRAPPEPTGGRPKLRLVEEEDR